MYNWECLARAVRERRMALGMTQADVAAAGGPSSAKVREIENLRASVLSPGKRRDLERALRWTVGSVDVVLDGGSPEVLGADSDPHGRQGGDGAAPLQTATEIQSALKTLHEQLPTVSLARLHLLDAVVAIERAVRELAAGRELTPSRGAAAAGPGEQGNR